VLRKLSLSSSIYLLGGGALPYDDRESDEEVRDRDSDPDSFFGVKNLIL
jgi:hypothetical protein